MKDFVLWFKAQFGKSPHNVRRLSEISAELSTAREKTIILEKELVEAEKIIAMWDAALKAKNAAETNFKF